MSEAYSHLFEPITVGSLTLPNRALMGSMHTGLEEVEHGFDRLAAFYAERVRGGVGLIVTGGISPNAEGRLNQDAAMLTCPDEVARHRIVTDAVHAEGGRICMQVLHAGRYAAHPDAVAPSPLRSPISPVTPRELDADDIARTIGDFARCAGLAKDAGYDGVEIMGSEGYLINQFCAPQANRRDDEWGGSPENRRRFYLEVMRAVREATGPDFLVIARLSMLDLVPQGSTRDEVLDLAGSLEDAGADVLNTGIGWHEARVPTIATSVPRAAFTWVTRMVKDAVNIPVVTVNRINSAAVAEQVLAAGNADMVSMARPFLADPDLLAKSAAGRPELVNTCIACNQACLDHTFSGRLTSCLVNPRAAHETELPIVPATSTRRIAVVGGGPAGLATASTAARRGHHVTLFESEPRLGGQFNLACRVPGKEEYAETIRYFAHELSDAGVDVRLGTRADSGTLAGFDAVVLATGVTPRVPDIPGIDHPSVVTYHQLLAGERSAGRRVAVLGAGGIGFDVAEFLSQDGESESLDRPAWERAWGVDEQYRERGGVRAPAPEPSPREITLLQRKDTALGIGLGRTTGWIHRMSVKARGVRMLRAVRYTGIDDEGLHFEVNGEPQTLQVDTIVLCTGQESLRELLDPLQDAGVETHVVGGADVAAELDAKRAIRQGTLLAASL